MGSYWSRFQKDQCPSLSSQVRSIALKKVSNQNRLSALPHEITIPRGYIFMDGTTGAEKDFLLSVPCSPITHIIVLLSKIIRQVHILQNIVIYTHPMYSIQSQIVQYRQAAGSSCAVTSQLLHYMPHYMLHLAKHCWIFLYFIRKIKKYRILTYLWIWICMQVFVPAIKWLFLIYFAKWMQYFFVLLGIVFTPNILCNIYLILTQ